MHKRPQLPNQTPRGAQWTFLGNGAEGALLLTCNRLICHFVTLLICYSVIEYTSQLPLLQLGLILGMTTPTEAAAEFVKEKLVYDPDKGKRVSRHQLCGWLEVEEGK